MNVSKGVKKLIKNTLKKYDISIVNVNAVKTMVTAEGYIVIRFSPMSTVSETRRLIEALYLEERTSYCDSFTYNDRDHRIVFIRRDVSEDEFMYLLSVELGRILTFRTESDGVIGISADEDRIAHEFAYHICDMANHGIIYNIFKGYTVLSITAALAFIFGISMLLSFFIIKGCTSLNNVFNDRTVVSEDVTNTDDAPPPNIVESHDENTGIVSDDSAYDVNAGFYATKSGEKYHSITCGYISGKDVHLVTSEEIASGKYSACSKCVK